MPRPFLARLFSAASAAALLQLPSAHAAEPAEVVLINTFEVQPGREQECLAMWNRAAEFLRGKPGIVSTALHEALAPQAKFRYVNVAVWKSPQAFQAAVSDPGFRALAATDACTGGPALYRVVQKDAPAR